MSSLQKLFLGPSKPANCQSCGKSVSISWRHSLWLFLPLVAGLFALRLFELSPQAIIAYGSVGAVVILLALLRFVPLSRDGLD